MPEEAERNNPRPMKHSFEDLDVWKKAYRLTVELYQCLKELKDWGFRDQICRAAVSICSNIAEGFERGSTQEFIRFLFIAKGSAGEVRTQLYLTRDLGYLEKEESLRLMEECKHISAMIQNLITSLKKKKEEEK